MQRSIAHRVLLARLHDDLWQSSSSEAEQGRNASIVNHFRAMVNDHPTASFDCKANWSWGIDPRIVEPNHDDFCC
jgi:hypothetical protein